MKVLALVLAFAVSSSMAQSVPVITAMEVKTADVDDATMNLGFVDVEIINRDFELCRITHLNSDANDFTAGEVNEFDGGDLEGCLNFPLPGGEIGILRLIHSGPDAWIPEWVRVFTNGTFLQCNDGTELDNNDAHDLDCA